MGIYDSKKYIIITAIALLLILASLYMIFFKGVELGVDFKGGSLITIDSTQNIAKEEIGKVLEREGYEKYSINKFQTPLGYRYEVELPNPDYIFKAETARENFEQAYQDYIKVSQEQNVEAQNTNIEKMKESLNQLIEVEKELGIKTDINETNNVNELNSNFYEIYYNIQKEHEKRLRDLLSNTLEVDSFSLQIVSPLLSSSFTSKAVEIAMYSALLVMIFVFYVFRRIVPSLAVLIGALSDLIIALGGMAFFNIPLNLATFSTMLMIVGYSLDTDTMLTVRAAKRKDRTLKERIEDAFKTGTNMSTTAILAFSVVFLLSTFFGISLYYEIASVALIGLVGDLFATWGINAVILLKFLKK